MFPKTKIIVRLEHQTCRAGTQRLNQLGSKRRTVLDHATTRLSTNLLRHKHALLPTQILYCSHSGCHTPLWHGIKHPSQAAMRPCGYLQNSMQWQICHFAWKAMLFMLCLCRLCFISLNDAASADERPKLLQWLVLGTTEQYVFF